MAIAKLARTIAGTVIQTCICIVVTVSKAIIIRILIVRIGVNEPILNIVSYTIVVGILNMERIGIYTIGIEISIGIGIPRVCLSSINYTIMISILSAVVATSRPIIIAICVNHERICPVME